MRRTRVSTRAAGLAVESAHVAETGPPAAPPPDGDGHDIGVLLVHGIGDQQRGSTLVDFGEPLHHWLVRRFEGLHRSWHAAGLTTAHQAAWFEAHGEGWLEACTPEERISRLETLRQLVGHMHDVDGAATLDELHALDNPTAHGLLAARVHVRDARTRTSDDDAPATASMDLHGLAVDGSVHRSRWLLAEAWWAESFAEPTVGALARWLLMIIPWTLGTYYGGRVRRAWRRMKKARRARERLGPASGVLLNALLLVLSLPAAVIAEIVVLGAIGIALLPLPRVQGVLIAAQRLVARTLGDSFVLLASPLQQAAIVASVQRDLAWLGQRCRTVVVVAHSQGAAVAHRALRLGWPPQTILLITFGSGLRKLEELEAMSRVTDGFFGRTYLTVSAVLLLVYSLGYAAVWQGRVEPWSFCTGAALFAIVLLPYLMRPFTALDWFNAVFEHQAWNWVDIHASSDPVPDGPLREDADDTAAPPVSFAIHNERSFLRDHTTYWTNVEQFVGLVAWWLTRAVPGPWHEATSLPLEDATRASVRRTWRVNTLVAGRWFGWAAVALAVWAQSAEWRMLLAWASAPAVEPVATLLGRAWDARDGASPSLTIWTQTVGAVAALQAIGYLARMAWGRWGVVEQRMYFDPTCAWPRRLSDLSGGRYVTGAYDAYAAASTYVSLVALQGLIAAALVAPALASRYRLGLFWWSIVASVIGLLGAACVMWPQRRAVQRALQRRQQRMAHRATAEALRVSNQVRACATGPAGAPSHAARGAGAPAEPSVPVVHYSTATDHQAATNT